MAVKFRSDARAIRISSGYADDAFRRVTVFSPSLVTLSLMRAILFLAALYLCVFLGVGDGFAVAGEAAAHVPGTSVEMPYVIAPVTIDGKLVSYAYVSSRIIASTPSAAMDVRDRLPFIQDANVRDVNASSIADASDPPVVDRVALVKRLVADAKRVVGDNKVSTVQIIQIQFSQLRPSPRS